MDHDAVRELWSDRTGAYSPRYYAHHGTDRRSRAVAAVLTDRCRRDASVLEVGCGSGRHLAHLRDRGFRDVAGVDINADAFDVMARHSPGLAADGTFHVGAIEDVVTGFDGGAFDVVFSVETLQHVHPESSWVFGELARITGDLLVTLENETATADPDGPRDGGADAPDPRGDDGTAAETCRVPLYPRDWGDVFEDAGLMSSGVWRGERDTLRAFDAP